jgi:hypothetical protein
MDWLFCEYFKLVVAYDVDTYSIPYMDAFRALCL